MKKENTSTSSKTLKFRVLRSRIITSGRGRAVFIPFSSTESNTAAASASQTQENYWSFFLQLVYMYRYFLRSPCTLHFLRLQNLGRPRGPPCTSSPRVGLEVQKVENKSPQCAVLSCLSPLIRSVGWHHAVDMALESLESQVPGNSFCVLGGPDALLLHAWKHWKRQKCILFSISVSFRTDSFSDRFSDRNLKIGRCPKNRTVWQHCTSHKTASCIKFLLLLASALVHTASQVVVADPGLLLSETC